MEKENLEITETQDNENKNKTYRVKGQVTFIYNYDVYIEAENEKDVYNKINEDLEGFGGLLDNLENERFDDFGITNIEEVDGEIIMGTFFDRKTLDDIRRDNNELDDN